MGGEDEQSGRSESDDGIGVRESGSSGSAFWLRLIVAVESAHHGQLGS